MDVTQAAAEPPAKPDLKDIALPYVVERCLLMTTGRWNGVDFPASAIVSQAKKLAADKTAMVRLYEGATTDHQDSTGTLIGHTENHEWDGKTLWGDCVFIVEKAARVAAYQKETKLKLEGISPRMATQPEWKPANARIEKILEFKSFGIVLDPAQGAQAMLGKDSEGRTLLGDGPVVLLEDATLPFPNEHAARLKTPESLTPFVRIRRTEGSGDGTVQGVKVPESISVIWYIIKREGKEVPVPQALRFPTKTWTEDEARKWLKDNEIKPILFEPASEAEESKLDADPDKGQGTRNPRQQDGGRDWCYCPKCDKLIRHIRGIPCVDMKCPICDGALSPATEKQVKEVSELKKLFCEKCDLLFDASTEKCSKCEGTLKEADEATVARLEEKAGQEAKAAAQKKAEADALAKKEADEKAAAEAEAQKQKAIEFPEATHKSRPYLQGPNGYKHPYYGKPEGVFYKEPAKVRSHVFSRKPALDQVADLEELTQDLVGFCGSVLKAHLEGKLELEQAIVEITAMLREIPLAAELSKEEVQMDDVFMDLIKENEEHKKTELETELKTIIDDGKKLPPAVREEVEALLSISADAVLSEEGEAVDVAGLFRKIVKELNEGAALSLDKKTKRLVGSDSELSKEDEKTPEEKRKSGASIVPKNMRKKEKTE